MACESCRLRTTARLLMRSTGSTTTRTYTSRSSAFRLPRVASSRTFSSTSHRQSLLKSLGASVKEPYRVLGATQQLFKVCAAPANYKITEEERNNDKVLKLEDGEEVGHPLVEGNVWHNTFKLPPTFSTWSHVTMLHLYLINARVRCFERDTYRNWQQQLVDHFFFECEKKMHLDHGIVSSAIRQRYLKDIFVQWRGLLLAYDEGLIKGDAVLASAVWRNLFKGSPEVDPRSLVAIVGWLRAGLAQLEALKDEDVAIRAEDALKSSVSFYWETLEGPFSKVNAAPGEAEEVVEETDAQKKLAAQRRAAAKKATGS
ncbi:hypothetical protein NLU13_2820 [Sarocladium strictum]|uniref:Ubiquinol-cytochrome c chaperone domain-containing protein n=1 Tax=Sarocladium strictum TaxID=5046 RepID=A0AA39GKV1_SARSR|nr:hypothetical protein NLU13_2820 [Sarocladium strictum]